MDTIYLCKTITWASLIKHAHDLPHNMNTGFPTNVDVDDDCDFIPCVSNVMELMLNNVGVKWDDEKIELQCDFTRPTFQHVINAMFDMGNFTCALYAAEGPLTYRDDLTADEINQFNQNMWDAMNYGGDDDVDYNGTHIDMLAELILHYCKTAGTL